MMRRAMTGLMIILLAAGAVSAKGLEMTKKAGANTVVVTLQNNPPATGDNGITVAVRDATGKAVTDARVVVHYVMPAMPGMPAMSYKASAVLRGDVYAGKLNFSMPGAWQITVRITRANRTESVRFNADVH